VETWTYEFWLADGHGLIRQRRKSGRLAHPEVWRNGRWITGSSFVVDAITGMGEDAFSCGEFADALTISEAKKSRGRTRVNHPGNPGDSFV